MRRALIIVSLLGLFLISPVLMRPISTPQPRVEVVLLQSLTGFKTDTTTLYPDMAVGDVDGDGHDEIVLNVPRGFIYVLKWNETTQRIELLDNFTVRSGTHHQAITIGDVNKDGINEIIVGNNYDDIYFYKYNSGTKKFEEIAGSRLTYCGGNIRGLLVGDFDKDTNPDLAVLINGSSLANVTIIIYENSSSGFTKVFNGTNIGIFFNNTVDGIASGDVDGDGNIEIGLTGYNITGDTFVILECNGNDLYSFEYGTKPANNPKSIALTDADNDGYKEFTLVANNLYIYFIESTGSNTYNIITVNTGTQYLLYTYQSHNHQIAFLGDADGNGLYEIVIAEELSKAAIYESTGDNTFVNRTTIQAPSIPSTYQYTNAKVAIADVWGGEGKEIIIAGPNTDNSEIGINIYGFPDTTPPTVSGITGPSGSHGEDDDLYVSASITDSGYNASGVNQSAVFVRWNSSPGTYHDVPMNRGTGDQYIANLKGQVSIGNITYFVVARDRAGNEKIEYGGEFQLSDTKPPVIQAVIVSTSVNYMTNINVVAQVTDASLDKVLLIYNTGGGNATIVMNHAGDSNYTGVIPGQPYGTVVSLWIFANDSVNHIVYSSNYTINIVDTIPPTISNVEYIPQVPVAGDTITVSANVVEPTGASGVKNVTLKYRVNGGVWNSVPMTLSGGKYHAQIGGFSAGDYIDFKISAEDNAGNTVESGMFAIEIGSGGGGAQLPFPIEFIIIGLGAFGAVIIIVIALKKRGKGGGEKGEFF
ncbi:MAG: FG-GAP-like repeat-containing protein [Candidatus Korarchaeota archaeon]